MPVTIIYPVVLFVSDQSIYIMITYIIIYICIA